MTVYKIRHPSGQYSSGGSQPTWKRRGKTWTALNHLTAHLTLLRTEEQRWEKKMASDLWTHQQKVVMQLRWDRVHDIYEDCTVVRFEVQEQHTTEIVAGVMMATPITGGPDHV